MRDSDSTFPEPQDQASPGLTAEEMNAEQAEDLPDRHAMTVLNPTALGRLTDPSGSELDSFASPPSGVSLPGIGTLGLTTGPSTEPTVPGL